MMKQKNNNKFNGINRLYTFLSQKHIIAFVLLMGFVAVFGEKSIAANKTQKILIINSNSSVGKYSTMQNEFEEKSNILNVDIDLGKRWKDKKWIRNTIRDVNPELILCIGSKGYIQIEDMAKRIPKILSLAINWERMSLTKNTYVVASEVPATTQLTMYRYFFPEISKIGVIYSKANHKQWFKKTVSEASDMGIKIIGRAIKESSELNDALENILPKVDAFWLISEPIILSGKKQVLQIFKQSDKLGKPVFAYERIFGDYGASFVVSADVPTMARQVAQIASDILDGSDINVKVEDPVGSHISINLEKIEKYGIKLNSKAIHSVNYFIDENR